MQKIIVDICAIIMPTLLGYVVWLLKNQKKDRDANSKERCFFCVSAHRIS